MASIALSKPTRRRLPRMLSAATALLLAWSGGCTSGHYSAILSSDEILEELDEIVRVGGEPQARKIVYADEAMLSAFYMRLWLTAPIRQPLAWIFGRRNLVRFDRGEVRPEPLVQSLLRELPDETSGELWACGAAASRFGWMAELDTNALTRVIALDGLARICTQLQIQPFAGAIEDLSTPLAAEVYDSAQATLRRFQAVDPQAVDPQAADPAASPGVGGDRPGFQTALEQLTSRPAASAEGRLRLVEDLTALYANEADEAARAWVDAALRRSIGHCARGILLGTVQGRDPRLAELRLCALEQIRRLGGPSTVPLLLAVMAASPSQRKGGLSAFDPDTLVQLRLIHYCGQLTGDLAEQVVQLPGRQGWEATSPVEFLAQTVLKEQDYYSKLRTPAIVALSWCLGRPHVDPDSEWVRAWLQQRAAGS
ncbi:MAG: hypothetical protein AB8H80_11680 [Planctomycetota bacterium]